MSVRVVITGDVLLVKLSGWDVVAALRSSIRFPVSGVAGVAVAPTHQVPRRGLRLAGTSLPGLRAGVFGFGAAAEFWLLRKASQVLVIELEPGMRFRRCVLELPDAHATMLELRPVVGAFTGTF